MIERTDPGLGRIGPPLGVIGGLLRYRDTPVGAYDEAFATVVYPTSRGIRTTTPLIAVSSPASVLGERVNWAIPKVLAEFTGDLDTTDPELTASAASWSVHGSARPGTRALPLRARFTLAQLWADGRPREARLGLHLRAQPSIARISVDADASLSAWFRPGTYLSVLTHEFIGTIGAAR